MLYPEDKTIDLSISIVSYNVKRLLGLCLESIKTHTQGISYQVIVVDNGSRDGTVVMLAEKFPWVKVIANRNNQGFAAAQNKGLGMGRGRYLFSLDSDTYITEDAFTSMVRFMDQHPAAGAAGAKLLSPDGVRQYSRRRFPPSIWPVFYRGSFLKNIIPPSAQVRYYEMSDIELDSETEVDWVYGGNIIFRRQALEQMGLFDERFFIYCEDIDISYRLQEHGWKRYFVPEARIFHYGQQGTRQIKVRSYLRHVKSYLTLFHKYDWKLDERYTSNFDRKDVTAEVLLVMVSRNQKELLVKCLDDIYRNPPANSFKVVVVDDASRDGTTDHLTTKYPGTAVISNKKPKGYLRAVNQVLKMTESKYLVLVPLNPASIFGQFDQLHTFMEQTGKAGMAGMVSDDKRPFSLPGNDLNEKELFLANCMMIRRNIRGLSLLSEKAGKKVGDFEWCVRFRKEGWAVYYLLNP